MKQPYSPKNCASSKRIITQIQKEHMRQMYGDGKRAKQIANELKLPISTVFENLRKMGLTGSKGNITKKEHQLIAKLRQKDGKTVREIMKITKRSENAVRASLKSSNIHIHDGLLNKTTINKTIELYERYGSANKVSQQLGISVGAVIGRLRRNGIKVKNSYVHYDTGLSEAEIEMRNEEIINRYHSGQSINRIKNKMEIGTEKLSAVLHQNGINTAPKRLTEKQLRLASKKYQEGDSLDKAAAIIGADRVTLTKFLKKNGTPIRSNKISKANQNSIIEEYINGKSTQSIAETYNCSGKTVNRLVQEAGFEIRPLSEAAILRIQNYPTTKGRGHTQYYKSKKTGKLESADSAYEIARMLDLDSNNDVKRWTRYHMSVKYMVNGKNHLYNPDLLIEHHDGSLHVEEIKASWMLSDIKVRAKHEAALSFFNRNGINFYVLTEANLGGKARLDDLRENYHYKPREQTIRNALNARYRLRRNFMNHYHKKPLKECIQIWFLPDKWEA